MVYMPGSTPYHHPSIYAVINVLGIFTKVWPSEVPHGEITTGCAASRTELGSCRLKLHSWEASI